MCQYGWQRKCSRRCREGERMPAEEKSRPGHVCPKVRMVKRIRSASERSPWRSLLNARKRRAPGSCGKRKGIDTVFGVDPFCSCGVSISFSLSQSHPLLLSHVALDVPGPGLHTALLAPAHHSNFCSASTHCSAQHRLGGYGRVHTLLPAWRDLRLLRTRRRSRVGRRLGRCRHLRCTAART